MKKTIYFGAIALAIAGIIICKSPLKDTQADEITSTSSTPIVNYQHQALLGALEWCESNGSTTITILDSNDTFSYGVLMFQLNTFIPYGIKYGYLAPTTTIAYARTVVHDPILQENIASDMLRDGLGNHWKTCYAKIAGHWIQ